MLHWLGFSTAALSAKECPGTPYLHVVLLGTLGTAGLGPTAHSGHFKLIHRARNPPAPGCHKRHSRIIQCAPITSQGERRMAWGRRITLWGRKSCGELSSPMLTQKRWRDMSPGSHQPSLTVRLALDPQRDVLTRRELHEVLHRLLAGQVLETGVVHLHGKAPRRVPPVGWRAWVPAWSQGLRAGGGLGVGGGTGLCYPSACHNPWVTLRMVPLAPAPCWVLAQCWGQDHPLQHCLEMMLSGRSPNSMRGIGHRTDRDKPGIKASSATPTARYLQDLVPFLDALAVSRASLLHTRHEDAHVVPTSQLQPHAPGLHKLHNSGVRTVPAKGRLQSAWWSHTGGHQC